MTKIENILKRASQTEISVHPKHSPTTVRGGLYNKKNWNEWTPAKSKDIYVPGNELNFFIWKKSKLVGFWPFKME